MTKRSKKERTLEEELYRIGLVFLIAGVSSLYVAIKWVLPRLPEMDCVFERLFGLYCPGCGGTRAVLALLRGRFLESLWYHPIVLYTAGIFGWFMLSHTLSRLRVPLVRGMRFHPWHLYGALVVIAGNCLVKNILRIGFHILM